MTSGARPAAAGGKLDSLLAIGALWQVLLATGLDAALPAWLAFLLLTAGAATGGLPTLVR